MIETTTASVFRSGRSQAVRIPKAFWFDTERVEIRRRGQEVVLRPIAKEDQWAAQREAIAMAKQDKDLLFEVLENGEREGYPRMGFDEAQGHFEMRVRGYEERREAAEQAWRQAHGK